MLNIGTNETQRIKQKLLLEQGRNSPLNIPSLASITNFAIKSQSAFESPVLMAGGGGSEISGNEPDNVSDTYNTDVDTDNTNLNDSDSTENQSAYEEMLDELFGPDPVIEMEETVDVEVDTSIIETEMSDLDTSADSDSNQIGDTEQAAIENETEILKSTTDSETATIEEVEADRIAFELEMEQILEQDMIELEILLQEADAKVQANLAQIEKEVEAYKVQLEKEVQAEKVRLEEEAKVVEKVENIKSIIEKEGLTEDVKQELIRIANLPSEADKLKQINAIGRSIQKHSSRENAFYPQSEDKTPAGWSKHGINILNELLSSSTAVSKVENTSSYGETLKITDSRGFEIWFYTNPPNGLDQCIGFREPKNK